MRWVAALLILLALTSPPEAQQAEPAPVLVRQSVVPATGAVVGQRVTLHVDVLFRDAMPRPPRVSLADVPGLQIFRFETQGVTMRETVAGADYVGQRFEYALYARRGGVFAIPPANVTLLDHEGTPIAPAQGASVRLEVTVPPGVDLSQPVVATRALVLAEQWSPDPWGRFEAGGAIVRTITRSAEDVPGLAMRDLGSAAPDGVRVYVDPPDIADHANRGVVTGRRVDRITYVFERSGRFELPSVRQPWWNLGSRRLEEAEAPPATVEVGAAPAVPGGAGRWTRASVIGALALLAVGLALAWGMRRLVRRWNERRAEPEPAAFRGLARACAGADAAAIYRRLTAWSALLPAPERALAERKAGSLQARLFGSRKDPWRQDESQTLLRELRGVRAGIARRQEATALPPLNPVAEPMPDR